MKQAEIRRYRPGERTNPYLAAGWMALLAALLLSGSLLTMQRLWNGRDRPLLPCLRLPRSAHCAALRRILRRNAFRRRSC